MIDLIDECGSDLSLYGYKTHKLSKYGASVSTLQVEEDENNFESGQYSIISCPLLHALDEECHRYICGALKREIKKMKGNTFGKVLVVGLGNPTILADCLGIKVVENVQISSLKNNHIFKFCPNIFATTGIDSFEVVHLLVKWLKVDFVVVIDSLATKNLARLGTTIQINSAGMTPGSAVNNLGKKISKSTLGVPCFAIGVPLMFIHKDSILTPKDIHENLNTLADIISTALNTIL